MSTNEGAILKLTDILPQKIQACVLEIQENLRNQLCLTVKTRLEQCLSSEQISYEGLNLELPET